MGNLLVLGDSEIREILLNLPRAEILLFRDAVLGCLREYSVGSERAHQPSPGVVRRPEGQLCLFRPFTSSRSLGAKIVVQPASAPTSTSTSKTAASSGLHGIITLCDANGLPSGILNAEEVTGYRTSISALTPWLWRRHAQRNIVVFGAGKQALWHLRLALALRGEEIESVVVINRTVSRAETLLAQLREENTERRWNSPARMHCLDPSRGDYQILLRDCLGVADAIFCTAGAKTPLFPAAYIINNDNEDEEGQGRGGENNRQQQQQQQQPYISAVGSWQPDMIELDPALLLHLAAQRSKCRNGSKAGSLLVDDRETVVPHTGELLQSKLDAEHIVELGEIADLRSRADEDQEDGGDPALREWLEEGLLVYKSIGVGMTDLAASERLLAFARERQLGTTVTQF